MSIGIGGITPNASSTSEYKVSGIEPIRLNSSTDYNGLAIVIINSSSLKQSVREFIYTFDPHRFYMSIQDMNNSDSGSKINTYA